LHGIHAVDAHAATQNIMTTDCTLYSPQ